MRRAATLPAPTAAPMIQNSAAAPSAAPATPNSSGISALDRLIVIERSAIASPWRSCGVIWCRVVMIIGCTAPSASPSSTAQMPIATAVRHQRIDREHAGRGRASRRPAPATRAGGAPAAGIDQPHRRHRDREDAEHEADRRGAEAALVAEDRHQEGVHVPARRQQPVDQQQAAQARREQQVERPLAGRRARRPPAPRRGTQRAHHRPPAAAAATPGTRRESRRRRSAMPASTGPTTFASAGARPSQLKTRLQLGRVGGAAPGAALDRDQADVGARAGQRRRRRTARGTAPASSAGRGHRAAAAGHRQRRPRCASAGGSHGGRPDGRPAAPARSARRRTAPAARRPPIRLALRAAPAAAPPGARRPCRHAGRSGRRSARAACAPEPTRDRASAIGSSSAGDAICIGSRPSSERRRAAAPARARRAAPRRSCSAARHRARAHLGLHRSCCSPRRASSCVFASTSPNLPNSVLTAPSTSHTSALRFSSASVRKPICRLVSVASSVVGPASDDAVLALQRLDQTGPAQRLGVQALGRHEQDAEVGGVRRGDVLRRGSCAPPRAGASRSPWRPPRRRPRRRAPAHRAGARSPRAGTCSRSAATAARRRRARPGRRIANSTRALLPGTVSTLRRVLLGREHLLEQRRRAAPRRTCRASSRWSARATASRRRAPASASRPARGAPARAGRRPA